MAQEQYSLSWFKKRTAAINKIAGTKLSPTQLYKAQKTSPLARDLIADVTRREAAAQASGRRRLSAPDYAGIAKDRALNIWAGFASSNRYASGLLGALKEGGHFISANGNTLYREYNGHWFSIDPRTGALRELKQQPRGAHPLTVKDVNEQLNKTAKNARKYRQNTPTQNYQNVR